MACAGRCEVCSGVSMTVADVKRELPDVPVKIGRKVYSARLSGRLNQFATVTLSYIHHSGPQEHLRGQPWMDWQFSWEAVTRAVNTGNPLSL